MSFKAWWEQADEEGRIEMCRSTFIAHQKSMAIMAIEALKQIKKQKRPSR